MINSRSGVAFIAALVMVWSQGSPAAVNVDRTRIIMDA
ncbi:fimbrial chaperone protein StdC, partial [Salmonella enterica subsp. diarizonae serovar 16:z10:e,n,x,z15]|nr:fimbrial chaperone protein StdC [Salmonella enterica]EBW8699086.1 fimbrial chaperone protein StdC [Salmonella enterica subsp. diarizonae serovar 16:z10:e,n,x,z15]MIV47322.1 fimbrial chaperone protein StdC [Salmonella enterica]